jgi:hypothetical protein
MGLIMFRKGRELEVGIRVPREFESGVCRLERDLDFDMAYRTKGESLTAVEFTAYSSVLSL